MESTPWTSAVRSLGWENLDSSFEQVSAVVCNALAVLGLPHSVTRHIDRVACEFIIEPIAPLWQPFEGTSCAETVPLEPLRSVESDSPDALRIRVQIFAAEEANCGKHHLRIRRLQGSHWRYQAFYCAFRSEFSRGLGLPDERMLAAFSPLAMARTCAAPAMAGAALCNGCPAAAPAIASP